MAYVAPTVRSVGDAVTAADYNIMANNALQFAPFVQGVFTTEAVRDAAITSPTEGMHAYLTASTVAAATGAVTNVPTGVQTIYNGSAWVCVTEVGASTPTSGTRGYSPSGFGALTGGGTNPTVTLSTGTSAFVNFGCTAQATTGASNSIQISVSVSGATTISGGSAPQTTYFTNPDINSYLPLDRGVMISGLTAGTNTFTLQYYADLGTNTFYDRSIIVKGIA